MKKHILFGLVAAAFCMDSANAAMDWYGKVGMAVQGGKDTLPEMNQDNSYTTFGGYVGMGMNVDVSDNLGIKCEIGTTIMPNRTKRWLAKVRGNPVASLELKGNNSVPRAFVALSGKLSGDASVYGGVGAARTSNKATAHINGVEVDKLTNNKYELVFVGGMEKRFGNWGGVIEGSYVLDSHKKIDGVKVLGRENNLGINACIIRHI